MIKKILLWILGIILLLVLALGVFIYKATNGLPFYDKKPPIIHAEFKAFSILNFTKTNGYRHGSAIKASTAKLDSIATANGWMLYTTKNAAIHNKEQLEKFDLVIWNNATGRNLTDRQRAAFKEYMESGGGFLGIHGAGDFSHHWKWYEETLIGANFSHHSLEPQIQSADMHLECDSASHLDCHSLPEKWTRSEEWYVFFDNPRTKDFNILYTVDEKTFNPSGNMKYLVSNKDFGMGDDHPIVWYKCLPNGGRTFYSALGHNGDFFNEPQHLDLLVKGILWAGQQEGKCE